MQRDGANLVFSPHDFIAFLEGDFSAWMARREFEIESGNSAAKNSAVFGIPPDATGPDEDDEESLLVQRRGREHESEYLSSVRAVHPDLVSIDGSGDPLANTLTALRSGISVVYQGRISASGLFGIPDFLCRTSGPSDFGEFAYEPHDAKLAMSAKPHFLVQLCAYAAILEAIQGRRPEQVVFVSGKSEQTAYRTEDFIFYFRHLAREFLRFQRAFDPSNPPMPANEVSVGRWAGVAEKIFEQADHLSRVAGISVRQINKLVEAGIETLTGLAQSTAGSVPKLSADTFAKLQRQAQAQLRTTNSAKPYFEVLSPSADRPRTGLTDLPPASLGDVFFDMEGFPLIEGGLEYLFGASHLDGSRRQFADWWAHDKNQERCAFESFVDWAHHRWQQDPAMHIYHYASYEITALTRLMQKHGSREAKVDDLLRNKVFVDLYRIVQRGLVIGTRGYSLKDIECLYQPKRGGAVSTAGGSIVAYQKWRDSGESQRWQDSPFLREIRDYNREDCDSLIGLRDWLLELRAKQGLDYDAGAEKKDEKTTERARPDEAVLAEKLLVDLSGLAESPRVRVQSLLSHVLEHHWREVKPSYWRMFRRQEISDDELFDDLDCLAGLKRTAMPPEKVSRSWVYEYEFDVVQETKLVDGDDCVFARDLEGSATIHALRASAGVVAIRVGPGKPEPAHQLSLIPKPFNRHKTLAKAIHRYVESWTGGVIRSQAIDDLLHRRSPRINGHRGVALISRSDELTQAVVDLVERMDRSTLCIQGPPGTGKTYTCAAVIAQLLKRGKSVGVTANSHKAILNVLHQTVEAGNRAGIRGQIYKAANEEDDDPLVHSRTIEPIKPEKVESIVSAGVVVGGTAWVFSRPELEQKFDYLFVDEAGQFSLANTIAVGQSARNLVLVGDPMQLPQPIQATHPGESGLSVLEYVLDGKPTIPPDVGVFLDCTRRLHPDICSFISSAIYENRLHPHDTTMTRRIIMPSNSQQIHKSTGIEFVAVHHRDNTQYSGEEVEQIQRIVAELKLCRMATANGERKLTLDDILFVAPYNMQVRKLQAALGDEARVGSVDKFQGQEAPVVIISMCASSLEDAPRGAEFLLNRNRLNVAISRAQCLAIIVGSPTPAAVRCTTIDQMRLVNLYCRLLEYSDSQGIKMTSAAGANRSHQ